MKAWLRRYLGHDQLIAHLMDLDSFIRAQSRKQLELNGIHTAALGRIVARLEPLFAVPEDDPARKKASDELGEKVIEKLKAEQAVLEKYGHKP